MRPSADADEPEFERDRRGDDLGGQDHQGRRGALPPCRRRTRSPARRCGTRARSGSSPVDDHHVWLTRQPREAVGPAASLEIPAGKLDVPGEEPLATRQARAGRGDRQAGRALGGDLRLLHQPGLQRRARLAVPGDRSCRTRPAGAEPDEDERIEIVPWPLERIDDAIAECEDSKSLIALLWLARASARPPSAAPAARRAPAGRSVPGPARIRRLWLRPRFRRRAAATDGSDARLPRLPGARAGAVA